MFGPWIIAAVASPVRVDASGTPVSIDHPAGSALVWVTVENIGYFAIYTDVSELQRAETSLPPVQSAYRLTRAAGGNTRLDSGNTSVISNPAAGHTILLDHINKTATIQPLLSAAPSLPGMPPMQCLSSSKCAGLPSFVHVR